LTTPNDPNAIQLYNEGLRNAKAGRLHEAIPLLERSIEADPSRVDGYNVLGKVLFQIGQTRKARRCWKTALELDPANTTALSCLNASGPARWLYRTIVPATLILLAFVVVWAFRSTRRSDQHVPPGPSIAPPSLDDRPFSSVETPSIGDTAHSTGIDTPLAQVPPRELVQVSEHPSAGADTVRSAPTDTPSVQPPSREFTQASTPSGLESYQEQDAQPQDTPIQTSQQLRRRYNAAMSAYQQKQFEAAIKEFRAILNAPFSHPLKDNAQYWLGECYYAQAQYKRALAEFERIPLRYPKGNKALHAQVKMAYCYVQLGQREQARTLLTRLVQTHPQDPAVRRAWNAIGQSE
jgi:tol-pal system protein YbgF